MTIRQQGGIFGRNPTFNNVTVDGTLTVDQIVEKTGAAGITLDGVTLKDGNVVLADGKGIDFSATAGTGTSELFDDYEEGTWTPALTYQTAGTVSFGYDNQVGYYTKVGRVVNLTWFIQLNAFTKGTASGYLRITGLPFTASALTRSGAIGSVAYFAAPTSTTSGSFPSVASSPNQSFLSLFYFQNNAADIIIDPDSDSQIFGSISYLAN